MTGVRVAPGVEAAWYYRIARKDLRHARTRFECAKGETGSQAAWLLLSAMEWLLFAKEAREQARLARCIERTIRERVHMGEWCPGVWQTLARLHLQRETLRTFTAGDGPDEVSR